MHPFGAMDVQLIGTHTPATQNLDRMRAGTNFHDTWPDGETMTRN